MTSTLWSPKSLLLALISHPLAFQIGVFRELLIYDRKGKNKLSGQMGFTWLLQHILKVFDSWDLLPEGYRNTTDVWLQWKQSNRNGLHYCPLLNHLYLQWPVSFTEHQCSPS